MSFLLGTTRSRTLAYKRRPAPACGSAKSFRPPPSVCKVQAASQVGMLLGGGGGVQGGKPMGTGSQAAWAPLARGEPSPGAGEPPKAPVGQNFGSWGWSCCKWPCSNQGCRAWSEGASGKGGLMLLPAVRGSPPGQAGHPRRVCQRLPATRCGKGQDAVWSILPTVPGWGAQGSCPAPCKHRCSHTARPNLLALLPSVPASRAAQGCQPPPARKEVSEQEHPHRLPVSILQGWSQAPVAGLSKGQGSCLKGEEGV